MTQKNIQSEPTTSKVPHVHRAALVGAFLYRLLRGQTFANDTHSEQRRRLILTAASWIVGTISSLWFLIYAWLSHAAGMLCMAFIAACGAAVGLLAARGRYVAGAVVLHASLLIGLSIASLWFDIPGDHSPRAAHLYFPTLAVLAYFLFEDDHDWLGHLMMLLNLGAFFVFSTTNHAFSTEWALPVEVQRVGVWINAIGSAVGLCAAMVLVHIRLRDHSDLLMDLRRAIKRQQLTLFYQPIVDRDGTITGSEALLRWNHPRQGLLPPGEFIDLAESSGLIQPIGRWVLSQACKDIARWNGAGSACNVSVNVNVTASELRQTGFVRDCLDIVQRSGAPTHLVRLELTESAMLHDVDAVIATMNELATHGIRFSLDDFGTGYSSLSYLERLPLRSMKIDRAFVLAMETERGAAIIETLLSLGQRLGLEVVAEGVETKAQWRYLKARGCTRFQGYLFSHPVDRARFEALVHAQSGKAEKVKSAVT